jgi:glutaredoxin
MRPLHRPIAVLASILLSVSAQAQIKVVGPDGRVTYTDRPPTAEMGRTVPMGREPISAEVPAASTLPLELRQVSTRFPVTLYASPDCGPCETGRRLLQTRGVPFVERGIVNDDDAEAMQRITGGRSVPALTIGTQALRGFSDTDWHAYLDAAGYPRESRLPRSYQPPASTPLVARKAEVPAEASGARATASVPQPTVLAPPPPPPAPTGIRF